MSVALALTNELASSIRQSDDDRVYQALLFTSAPSPQPNTDLFDGIDWEEFLRRTRHHGLLPLASHRLLEPRSGVDLPQHVRTRLKCEFRSNLLRNFGLLEHARRILHGWRESGIHVIPYKGPFMAEQLWGSFALRDCSDLDFLVPRTDVDRASRNLRQLGYRSVSPIAESLRPAFLRNASEEQFRHEDSKVLLELQWAPAPRTLAISFDEAQLWRDRNVIAVAGETVDAPCPEDLFCLLAIHGWKHNWSKLIWIADLAVLMCRYELDWTRIQMSAERGRWKRILLLALAMVCRTYGFSESLKGLNPSPKILSLAKQLEDGLRFARNSSYLAWHRDMLRARDSIAGQVHQLVNFVFTPGLAEYSSSQLPSWASPAYRIVRLARVLRMWPQKTSE